MPLTSRKKTEQRKPLKMIVSLALDEAVVAWVDGLSESLQMSRSEFVNFVLSGGKDAAEYVDRLIDKLYEQRKAEMKAKLVVAAR